MRAVDLIQKKRDGGELAAAEIDWFVQGLTAGDIPDYQASALLMAVYLRGMTPRETLALTMAMAHSGKTLDPHRAAAVVVDKHSTGGVGDKTTLIVEPLIAAAGLAVGKMSGRGLGFSGGTLDKLESIPGFRVDLTTREFMRNLKRYGIVLTGQSADLAPADGKLYALRDVTATISSLPLIASSVMSKKLAAGADAIVLDVKVGHGAFMKTLPEAEALARAMVHIGGGAGRRVIALLADMNQPLGRAVGNALEVQEALATLRDAGPADLRAHCLTVGAHMLLLGRRAQAQGKPRPTLRQARAELEGLLVSGAGLAKFRQLVVAQGGDPRAVDDPEYFFPRAALVHEVRATRNGWLAEVRADHVGQAAVLLGAGRARKGDPIDHAVGLLVRRRVGDRVKRGDVLFEVHANDRARLANALPELEAAIRYSSAPVAPLPAFYRIIR